MFKKILAYVSTVVLIVYFWLSCSIVFLLIKDPDFQTAWYWWLVFIIGIITLPLFVLIYFNTKIGKAIVIWLLAVRPANFKEANVVASKNQPQYQPLPALRIDSKNGEVISCWKIGILKRIKLLFTGRIWVSLFTFGGPVQPQIISTGKLFEVKK